MFSSRVVPHVCKAVAAAFTSQSAVRSLDSQSTLRQALRLAKGGAWRLAQ